MVSIFFAVLVFGVMCWSRDWLLNPNFNYLSWSYAFAVVAGGIHALAGFALLNVSSYHGHDRKLDVYCGFNWLIILAILWLSILTI